MEWIACPAGAAPIESTQPWAKMGILLRRLAFGVAVLAGALLHGGAQADELTRQEIKAAKEAFKLAERQRWPEAKKAAQGVSDPLLAKIFRWRYYAAAGSGAEFGEIAAFIKANPDWPRPRILRRRAEEAMTASTPDEAVIAWFSDHRPITSEGGTRLAASLLRREQTGKARQVIRETWIKGNFGARQEREFYRAFRRHLTREDHLDRLDRLLWAGPLLPDPPHVSADSQGLSGACRSPFGASPHAGRRGWRDPPGAGGTAAASGPGL